MTAALNADLSAWAQYRVTRFTVAALTLGRMMALFGNEKSHPEIVIADAHYEKEEASFARYLAALEMVANGELAAIQAAQGHGAFRESLNA